MANYVRFGGSWREANDYYIKVNDGWILATSVHIKQDGQWRQSLPYSASPPPPTPPPPPPPTSPPPPPTSAPGVIVYFGYCSSPSTNNTTVGTSGGWSSVSEGCNTLRSQYGDPCNWNCGGTTDAQNVTCSGCSGGSCLNTYSYTYYDGGCNYSISNCNGGYVGSTRVTSCGSPGTDSSGATIPGCPEKCSSPPPPTSSPPPPTSSPPPPTPPPPTPPPPTPPPPTPPPPTSNPCASGNQSCSNYTDSSSSCASGIGVFRICTGSDGRTCSDSKIGCVPPPPPPSGGCNCSGPLTSSCCSACGGIWTTAGCAL